MSANGSTQVTVAQLVHDLQTERSFVKLVWPVDDRRLHLPIPYGTELAQAHAAAEEALRKHEADIHTTFVKSE